MPTVILKCGISLTVDFEHIKSLVLHRPRILWIVLGAMLLVSVLPLALYHRQVLQLSQGKLTDTESVQQTEVTRSVGEEIQLFDTNLYQQLISERQILALTDLIDKVEDTQRAPQLTRSERSPAYRGCCPARVRGRGRARACRTRL